MAQTHDAAAEQFLPRRNRAKPGTLELAQALENGTLSCQGTISPAAR